MQRGWKRNRRLHRLSQISHENFKFYSNNQATTDKKSTLTFDLQHSVWKSQKNSHSILRHFKKQCYQTGNLYLGKMVKNAKIEKFEWDILDGFQTMWISYKCTSSLYMMYSGIKLKEQQWPSSVMTASKISLHFLSWPP